MGTTTWVRVDCGYEITWVRVDLGYELTVLRGERGRRMDRDRETGKQGKVPYDPLDNSPMLAGLCKQDFHK